MINSEEIDKLCRGAGELRSFRARKYVKEKRVDICEISKTAKNERRISAFVNGSENNKYSVEININNGTVSSYKCNCMDESRVCKHILATLLEVYNKYNDITEINKDTFKYKEFAQLMNSFSKVNEGELNCIKNAIR